MLILGSQALIFGGLLSAAAGLAHVAVVWVGAPAYRFMGAGEDMARVAKAGEWQPALVTLAMAGVLLVSAAYAFSGAGVMAPLPLAKWALAAIGAVYLSRTGTFSWLEPAFPERSQTFWLVLSGICLPIGLVHLVGLVASWLDL